MRKVEKTLGYILMSLLLTLILGLPNISYAVENTQSYKTKIENLYARSPAIAKVMIAASVGIICYQAFSTDFQPFIYFQF